MNVIYSNAPSAIGPSPRGRAVLVQRPAVKKAASTAAGSGSSMLTDIALVGGGLLLLLLITKRSK